MTSRLDRLRALHAAATPGPWVHTGGRLWQPWPDIRFDRDSYVTRLTDDAKLIVHGRNALPSLLACVDALREVHVSYSRVVGRLVITGDEDQALQFYGALDKAFTAIAPLLMEEQP